MSGHIYLVEVGPGLVKVGRTTNRFGRLASYAQTGAELLAWTSPRFDGYRGAETALIHSLAETFPREQGLETFRVSFTVAVDLARDFIAAQRAATREQVAA